MPSKMTLTALRDELGNESAPVNQSTPRPTATAQRSDAISNAFTIDVEDYYHVSALAPAIPARHLGSSANRAWPRAPSGCSPCSTSTASKARSSCSDGWLTTFRQLVKRIASLGHEVACHGYSHQLDLSPDARRLRGRNPSGEDLARGPHRQAGHRISRGQLLDYGASRWALDTLVELGFAYDSSIFPFDMTAMACPVRRVSLGSCQAPSGARIAEFPMSTARSGRAAHSGVWAVGISGCCPTGSPRRSLRGINEREGIPFTFYLHPWEIDVEQPRVKVNWLSHFRHYNNLSRCEGRLRRLLADFRFTTMAKVLRGRGLLSS